MPVTKPNQPRVNPDGTRYPSSPQQDNLLAVEKPQVPLQDPAMLDDLSALQTALAAILMELKLYSLDRIALISKQRVERGAFQIQRIFYDSARSEDDLTPLPSACIRNNGPTTIDYSDCDGQKIDECTLGCFGEGTIIQFLGYAVTPLEVVIWFVNKDDRAGARKVLVESFAGEILDERPGRRVSMPFYYEQVAQFTLDNIQNADESDMAKADEYPLVLSFSAETRLVRLIPAPGYLWPKFKDYAISL